MVKTVLKRMWWLVALMALVACNPKNSTPDDGGKDNGGLDNGGNDNGGNDNGGNDNGGNDNGDGNDNGGNDNGDGNDNGGNDNGDGNTVTIGRVEFSFDLPNGQPFPGHAGFNYDTGHLVYILVPVDRLDLYKRIYFEGARFKSTTALLAAATSTSAETYIGSASTHTRIPLDSAVTLNIRMQATETSDGPTYTRSGVGTFPVVRGTGAWALDPASTNFSRWSKSDGDVKAAATLRVGHEFYLGPDFYVMWGYASVHSNLNDTVIYSPLNSDHTVEQLDKFFRFSVVN
ncbi:hypothetical protein PVA47_06445 [Entomospira culicis]|nr:hypothetical protein [Entomospira culicis]WDI36954.1 hypothetical protein PVA46_06435 [Entomospira culicis]WDI38583.1 hypothetical protein PVA47_06445 [Entomospira culicis]